MDFLPLKNHFPRVFVEERSYPCFIDYGLVVFNTRPEYNPRIIYIKLKRKKIKIMYLMQEKEKEK